MRRSPTGRVPKWEWEEAQGHRPSDDVAFRAWTPSEPVVLPRRSSRFPTWTKVVAAVVLLSAAVAAVMRLGLAPTASTAAVAGGPRAAPPAGVEEQDARLGSPQAAPEGTGGFRFSGTQPDGATPVTWSPCRPVHVVVRPDHAPPGGDQMISAALQEVSAATGLVFVNDGATSEAPSDGRSSYQPDRYGDRWAPVLIAWATPQEVPDFGVDIAGEAGPARLRTPSGDDAYVSGTVYLDPAKIDRIRRDRGEPVARSVILHELGHLAGLAHVNDEQQLMWPRGNSRGLTGYQPGDLRGLAALGRGNCQPDT